MLDRAATPPKPINSLSVLVPVYNSEKTIGRLIDKVVQELRPSFERIEIILVNDGSQDGSHHQIMHAMSRYPRLIRYILLAKNFGEHNAVMCGLNYMTCDCVAVLDDDFQNPPSEVLRLVDKLREGYEVVYSYYERKQHGFMRNAGSAFNDWVATRLLRKPRALYLSSFKVMSKFLAKTVVAYNGPYPYLDGLILRSTNSIGTLLCEHAKREEGKSNYDMRRLVRLWLNMSTSFSIYPLRIGSLLGFATAAFGLLASCLYLVSWAMGGLFLDHEAFPPGWASIIISITLLSGVQLCVLGVLGEYLGRVLMTLNRQPQFIAREVYGVERPEEDKRPE